MKKTKPALPKKALSKKDREILNRQRDAIALLYITSIITEAEKLRAVKRWQRQHAWALR